MSKKGNIIQKKTGQKGEKSSFSKTRPVFRRAASGESPVGNILHLQHTLGNQEVQRLIKSGKIQAKLTIGKPNDKYEQEADRVADKVMSMRTSEPKQSLVNGHSSLVQRQAVEEEEPIQTKPLVDQITPLVQRQAGPEEEEEEPIQTKLLQRHVKEEEEEPVQIKLVQRQEAEEEEEVQTKLQRQAEEEEEEPAQTKLQRQLEDEEEEPIQTKPAHSQTPTVTSNIESSVNSLKGGGQPLSESTRSYFEPRFGSDFSSVRIHNDSKAAETAKSINAKAFTTGKDVVFGAGQYSPGTSTGKQLLAHELTHVVQKRKQKFIQLSNGPTYKNPIREAVRILKNSPRIKSPKTSINRKLSNAVNILSEEKVQGILYEEKERTGPLRNMLEYYELFTDTYGKGAIGNYAYTDVNTNFQSEITEFENIFGAPPSGWIDTVKDENWGVFYTAAYLFLSIAGREKTGRKQDDQMKIGIALYHGGRKSVKQAQTDAAKKLGEKAEDLTWSEIEAELKKTTEGQDIIDYVEGVTTYKNDKFDFTFNVLEQLVGKTRFYVGESCAVKVTSEAVYQGKLSELPAEKKPPPNYWIVPYSNSAGTARKILYSVGKKQHYTWENLKIGSYILRIYNRYINGDIPLKGEGTVEVKLQ